MKTGGQVLEGGPGERDGLQSCGGHQNPPTPKLGGVSKRGRKLAFWSIAFHTQYFQSVCFQFD
jgi:hypothetical protein